jgi:N-acylglucosamine-6-phosphate 2-epimerase
MSKLLTRVETLKWKIGGGLIVSCQAPANSPLARPEIIAAFAETAEQNGAVAVRIDSPAHVAAVKSRVKIPVLGIYKIVTDESDVYITPTFEAARKIADAGADLIALDATPRPRVKGEILAEIVEKIRAELGLPVMADVATVCEGENAEKINCDFVGTTLSGYTPETAHKIAAPDFELVETLAKNLSIPVICEGRLRSPAEVRRAFDCGAFAAVVGTAITGIDVLTRDFAAACPARGGVQQTVIQST